MDTPKSPQMSPYLEPVEPGKKAWCSCGLSENQPYCDGKHAGTSMRPTIVDIDAAKTVAWCGCKLTKSPPFCDGSHAHTD